MDFALDLHLVYQNVDKNQKDGQVIRNNEKMTTKAIINRQFA